MREGFKLQKMSILKFSDGIEIDTSGELRLLELYDGWYVVGEGRLIPVKDREEGEQLLNKFDVKPKQRWLWSKFKQFPSGLIEHIKGLVS